MKVKHAGCIKLRCDFKILSCELSAWNKVNNPVTSPLTCFRSKYKNFLEEVMSLLNIKCLQLTDILVLKYTIEIPKFLYIHVTKKANYNHQNFAVIFCDFKEYKIFCRRFFGKRFEILLILDIVFF